MAGPGPYVDQRAADAAAGLGLPRSADGLARLVDREDLPRLTAALIRTGLRASG